MPTIDPYGSHLPLLTAAVALTTGRVVELGSGLYSTPVLQAICLAQHRPLHTIDNDRDWLASVWREGSQLHTSQHIADWLDLHRNGGLLRCDVAFIDMAPASARTDAIRVMRRWARILVVHDTEFEQQHNYPGMEDAIAAFPYRVDDRRRGPWTTAVSADPIVLQLERAVA